MSAIVHGPNTTSQDIAMRLACNHTLRDAAGKDAPTILRLVISSGACGLLSSLLQGCGDTCCTSAASLCRLPIDVLVDVPGLEPQSCLLTACLLEQRFDAADVVLLCGGALCNINNDGSNVLHVLASRGACDSLQWLLRRTLPMGADAPRAAAEVPAASDALRALSSTDFLGRTPLHLALACVATRASPIVLQGLQGAACAFGGSPLTAAATAALSTADEAAVEGISAEAALCRCVASLLEFMPVLVDSRKGAGAATRSEGYAQASAGRWRRPLAPLHAQYVDAILDTVSSLGLHSAAATRVNAAVGLLQDEVAADEKKAVEAAIADLLLLSADSFPTAFRTGPGQHAHAGGTAAAARSGAANAVSFERKLHLAPSRGAVECASLAPVNELHWDVPCSRGESPFDSLVEAAIASQCSAAVDGVMDGAKAEVARGIPCNDGISITYSPVVWKPHAAALFNPLLEALPPSSALSDAIAQVEAPSGPRPVCRGELRQKSDRHATPKPANSSGGSPRIGVPAYHFP